MTAKPARSRLPGEGGASSTPWRSRESPPPLVTGSSACHRARIRAARWRMMTSECD